MAQAIRVGVLGARGKVGTAVCRAVEEADGVELVAALDAGDVPALLVGRGAGAVDGSTPPDVVMANLELCVRQGIHAVVGTPGFDDARLERLRALLGDAPTTGILIAPNF